MSNDPIKQAWNDVADGFSTLGRMMKEHYQAASADESGDVTAAAGLQDARAAIRTALEQLVAAGRELGDRAGRLARDDDVKAQAKRVATSLNDALAATTDLVGEQLGGLFKRSPDEQPTSTPEVPASKPPAEDARQ